ncbi:MAG TPA: hypothetical protein VGR37_01660 [Longimicrobiaceae bacterium]|nr:hypothetical protein [Longimicrobiaceae bacterium]
MSMPRSFSGAVDTLLRQDPCGAYAGMDESTRERYLCAVRRLAAHSAGLDAEDVARAALRRARSAAADPEARPAAAHVGDHLVGAGVAALEREVGYRPPLRLRAQLILQRHPLPFYLGLCALFTAAFVVSLLAYAAHQGAGAGMLLLAGVAVLPLAMEAAVSAARGLLHPRFPRRVLPKMAFADGIPDEYRTLVVIPTLLRSPEDARRQVVRLQRLAAENPGPNLRFALLSDFTDAAARSLPGDRAILEAARGAVRSLNARHQSATGDRFFVLHRERAWNPDEGNWTGWLRKSGKLEELFRLLREPGAETGFRWVFGNLPRAGAGVAFRYVITLDDTDQLDPGHAAALVRTAAHPLNEPWVDRRSGRVTGGYGLLQPAERSAPPAVRTRYTDLLHGRPSPDRPAAPAGHRPHFYTDVFGAGQFHGKGLVDVDAWRAVLRDVLTPAAVPSHDVLESFYARAANVGDVRMTVGPIDHYGVQKRVDARWTRGDCQLAPWLFPYVRDRKGRARRNPVPWALRLRLLRLGLSASVRPAMLVVLLLGWTVLPGPALAWTVVGLSHNLLLQALDTWICLAATLSGGRGVARRVWSGYLHRMLRNGFAVMALAHWAAVSGAAAAQGAWRALVSRTRRTEWTAQRQGGEEPHTGRQYLRIMWPSVALGTGVLPVVAAAAPDRLPLAALFALVWAAAPLWMWHLERPIEAPAVRDGALTTPSA